MEARLIIIGSLSAAALFGCSPNRPDLKYAQEMYTIAGDTIVVEDGRHYDDGKRIQIGTDAEALNLPSYWCYSAASQYLEKTEIAVAWVTPTEVRLITAHEDRRLDDLDQLVEYVDSHANREYPVLIKLIGQARWPQARQRDIRAALGSLKSGDHVGISVSSGLWFPPLAEELESTEGPEGT